MKTLIPLALAALGMLLNSCAPSSSPSMEDHSKHKGMSDMPGMTAAEHKNM